MWAQVLAIGSSEWRLADAWHKHTQRPQLPVHPRFTPLTSTHTQATTTHGGVNQSFSEPLGGGLDTIAISPWLQTIPRRSLCSVVVWVSGPGLPGRPCPQYAWQPSAVFLFQEYGGIPRPSWGIRDNGHGALSKHRPADNLTHSRIPERTLLRPLRPNKAK